MLKKTEKHTAEIRLPRIYDPFKTLLGNWYEDRADRANQQNAIYKHTTTYWNIFKRPPLDPNRSNLLWDQKLDNEKNNIIPQKSRYEDGLNFFNNFSTIYDLSYNHFPKCLNNYKIRTPPGKCQYKSVQKANDYLYSFGNMTKFGLGDYLKEKWQFENDLRRRSTNYQDTFIAPDVENYRFKRCATSITNSSILDETNKFYQRLKLRDQSISNVKGFVGACCTVK